MKFLYNFFICKNLSYYVKIFKLFLTVELVDNYRYFFCFPVGGAIAQVLGFFYLRCLWLNLRSGTFHLSGPLSKGWPRALIITAAPPSRMDQWCLVAAGVTGVTGWGTRQWALPPSSGSLGLWAPEAQGKGKVIGSWVVQAPRPCLALSGS